jgi:hypothetical protein
MPFGGPTVVFGGYFQQILPVIVKGSHPEIVNPSICSSYIWPLSQSQYEAGVRATLLT